MIVLILVLFLIAIALLMGQPAGSVLAVSRPDCVDLASINVGASSIDVGAANATYAWGFPKGGVGAKPPFDWNGTLTLRFNYTLPLGVARPKAVLLNASNNTVIAQSSPLSNGQHALNWSTVIAPRARPPSLWFGILTPGTGNNTYTLELAEPSICWT